MFQCRICAHLLGLLLGSLSALVSADVTSWNTDSSGEFNVPANWTNGVPGGADEAVFFVGSSVEYTVTFPGNLSPLPAVYQSDIARVDSNHVHFANSTDPNRGPSTYSIASQLTVGVSLPSAQLTNTLGTLSTSTATIADNAPSVGTLNLDAGKFHVAGSTDDMADLIVGNLGDGTLNIRNGSETILTGDEGNLAMAIAGGSVGTVNVVGDGSLIHQMNQDADEPLVVGGEGTGTLFITDGGQVMDFAGVLGLQAGGVGLATVSGPGSMWINDTLTVGNLGNASLTITDGGRVSDVNSIIGGDEDGTGIVQISGADSRWTQELDLTVGQFISLSSSTGLALGFGTLTIFDSAQVHTGQDASIGAIGSKANVIGNGALWTVAGLLETNYEGALEILQGGRVESQTAFVGRFEGGSALVSGSGSTWKVTESVLVGAAGDGTLRVTQGGQLNSQLGFLGIFASFSTLGNGVVEVKDPGSIWNCQEQLFIGYQGQGLLLINNGGGVNSGTGQVGFNSSSPGTVLISGADSKWVNTESIYLGVVGIGRLTVTDGGEASADAVISVGSLGLLEGNSKVTGKVRNRGTVGPGVSVNVSPEDALGELLIDGNYTQLPDGELDIELDSSTIFDKLRITGEAELAGGLDVSYSNNGFSPTAGMMFEVLRADAGVFNCFADLSLPVLDPGLGWDVIYSNFAVTLSVFNRLAGDYNDNGEVDAADYVIWRQTLGQFVAPGAGADGNANGMIDDGDYTFWRDRFRNVANNGGGASVPEPAPMTLLLVGLSGIAIRRR